jgi:serine/threonine protein kinase
MTDDGDRGDTTTADPPKSPGKVPEVPLSLGVSRYQIIERIGRGGMGEVLAARDTVLGREIAIKRMIAASPSEAQVDRFLREARIQGTLDHPSIPPVYELAHDVAGRPYFAMKRLAGQTLAQVLNGLVKNDPAIVASFSFERLLRAFAEVCRAVEFAHVRGVVHRDLKPANIMLGEFGEVFVLDWGVAKVAGATDAKSPVIEALAIVDDDATQGEQIVGTRGYMPPEQSTGQASIDGRADVYALGKVLADILSVRPDPPPELGDLVRSATELDLDRRLRSAWELGDRVQRYLDGDRDLAQRRQLAEVHLARALVAMTEDDQRLAMREAGRAMALDPTLPGAAELVGRLMLEPPRETPPEVEASLTTMKMQIAARQSRVGVVGSATLLAFIPFLLWGGMGASPYVFVFAALGSMQFAVALSLVRNPIPPSGVSWRKYAAIAINGLTVALLARMFSPFLITPGIAAVIAAILCSNPAFRRPSMLPVVVALTLGLLVPWAAELAGLVSPSISIFPDRMVIASMVTDANVTAVIVGLTVFGPVLVVGTALLMLQRVRSEDEIQRTVHLQAWRLRQLLPA